MFWDWRKLRSRRLKVPDYLASITCDYRTRFSNARRRDGTIATIDAHNVPHVLECCETKGVEEGKTEVGCI